MRGRLESQARKGRTIPLVMIALVWGGTLNSSAANFSTAVKGAASGTLKLGSAQKIQSKLTKAYETLEIEGERERETVGGKRKEDLHFVGQLRIGGQDHLKRDLSSACTTTSCRCHLSRCHGGIPTRRERKMYDTKRGIGRYMMSSTRYNGYTETVLNKSLWFDPRQIFIFSFHVM